MSGKITSLTAISSVQTDDVLPVVDVHDTTMASTGTTKKITLAQVAAAVGPTLPLAVAQGGTGQTAAAAGLNALGGAAVAGDLGNTSASPQVTGTHLASPLPVAQGGTGQAAQQTAIDALAGAQTSAQYLRGNGSHVVMSAIQAADLPGATTSVQGAIILDGTAADIQPGGTQAAGAKGQAADAKHVHPYQPYQFYAGAYGAKGDGKITTDAVMSNSSAVLTSASSPFISGDVGKHIIVNQGAANSNTAPLITTIASYQSAGQVTLAAACTSAVATAPAIWGTDDTAAIQAAVTAAGAYATGSSGNYYAEIVFDPKIYCIAGAPAQQTSPFKQNSQIPLPAGNVNNLGRKLIIKFTGLGDASSNQYWDSTAPNLQGTVLQSFSMAAASGTYGAESVIGGPTDPGGLAGGFVNVKAVIERITVAVPWNAAGIALDFRYLAAAAVPNASYQPFAAVNLGGATLGGPYLSNNATNGQSVALYMPLVNANADSTVGSFTAECVAYGFAGGDHLNCGRLSLIYTTVAAVYIPFGGAAIHGAWIGMLTVEAYKGDIILSGGSGLYPLNVGILNVEVNLGSGYDVNDSGNSFSGTLNWAASDRTAPSINGAGNLEIINQRQKPRGFVTGGSAIAVPSIPASTTALQNPFWRHATVQVIGGTVSQVAVDGQNTGLTSGMFRVPSGKTITLTYSSAPTWAWWLD